MEWRDIPGYEGHYQASDTGLIKSIRLNKILSPFENNNGYLRVNICVNYKKEKPLVHRLVALAFKKNPRRYKDVNHKDNDRKNNHVENLEWVPHTENIKQTWITGANKDRRKKC